MAKNLKAEVEKIARYYGNAARNSDLRAGFTMGSHEVAEYARDKFEDNFREAAASKYKAHFIATLRAAYAGKTGKGAAAKMLARGSALAKQKRMSKEKPPQKRMVKAQTLIKRACSSKHVPKFLKRYC